MGGCHSEKCDGHANEIWPLYAAHTPGVADKLSRDFNMAVEWQLHPTFFARISALCLALISASRINRQLDKYLSWKPDTSALLSTLLQLTGDILLTAAHSLHFV